MNAAFDIDALRAVVAGIDQQSFARAAVQLGRSQSAISMQLKKLEQQAGTQLFVRKGRGLVPTEAGEALVHYARRIIALNDEAALALGASVTSATVRLGLPQDFFEDVMPATLTAYAPMFTSRSVRGRITAWMKKSVPAGWTARSPFPWRALVGKMESFCADCLCGGWPVTLSGGRPKASGFPWFSSNTPASFGRRLWPRSIGRGGAGRRP